MSFSSLITTQPAACVFSSCPSLRQFALRGFTVSKQITAQALTSNSECSPKLLAETQLGVLHCATMRCVYIVFFQALIAFMITLRI